MHDLPTLVRLNDEAQARYDALPEAAYKCPTCEGAKFVFTRGMEVGCRTCGATGYLERREVVVSRNAHTDPIEAP